MRADGQGIPASFVHATSSDPAVQQWATSCAAGHAASLLILGAHWSGKSHTMYAAYAAAMRQGLNPREVAVPEAIDMTTTEATRISSHCRVVLIDPADYADPEYHYDVDGGQGYAPAENRQKSWDEPELQAMMALRDVAWQQLIEHLVFSTQHATIFTATSERTLRRALPTGLVSALLDRPTVMLEPRPTPEVEW